MTNPDGQQSSRQTPIDRTSIRVVPLRGRRNVISRYGIAVALTLAGLGFTLLLEPYLHRTIFLLFWPAVIATAWLGGFGPAMLTATASVALVDYFVLKPQGAGWDVVELVTFATFLGAAALTSWGVSVVEASRESAAMAASENARLAGVLDSQSEELTHQLEESQAMQEELEHSTEELAERTSDAETAESFTRGILESISDPFVVNDSDWRFRYVNAAAARIFEDDNRDPRSLIGQVVWEVWPTLRGSKIETEMRRAVETRTPVSFEAFSAEQGLWSELFCYPLPDGGLGTQWKDITDRKRADEAAGYLNKATVENARLHQAELEARRSAEAANEAKTQFLAVMSHELRTPLNAIGGYAELLLMGIRGSLTPDQQADLERIQRSQRNLLSLINDILNYANLEAGHVEFAMSKVQLHPLLLDIEPLITPQLRSKNLTYSCSGCSPTLTACADGEKVRQIMLNLLSNAIKFTEFGGTISISCDSRDDDVRVIVTDTGLGIPADRLSSVFEPFVQLERNLSSSHEGTGLGLAISRDLARGMGGELSARSTVGEGSAFELRLRRAEG